MKFLGKEGVYKNKIKKLNNEHEGNGRVETFYACKTSGGSMFLFSFGSTITHQSVI
jgi:hypothetical protein